MQIKYICIAARLKSQSETALARRAGMANANNVAHVIAAKL